MLPTKLTLSAFGSYAGHTEIPLDKLGKRGVYLITGETGAGKSTIFDAITFALYDMASGGKDKQLLRSQYAEPGTPTFVDLCFEHKGVSYRFLRYLSPRPGERLPAGVKDLLQIFTVEPDGKEKCINLNYKIKENKELVSSIIGVDYEQFKQVAMLAQGDFFKLVEAKSKDRKSVFSTIFDTSVFARIENIVKQENSAASVRVKECTKALRDSISALTPNDAHLTELTEITEAFKNNDVLTEDCLDKAILAARAMQTEDEEALADLKNSEKELGDKIADCMTMINLAQKAADTKAALEKALAQKKQLADDEEKASRRLRQAKAHEQDIKSFRETAAVEEKTLPKYRELTRRADELSKAKKGLTESACKRANVSARLESISKRSAEVKAKLIQLAPAEQQLEAAKNECEKAELRVKAAADLKTAYTTLRNSRSSMINAKNAFVEAQRRSVEANRAYLRTCMAAENGAKVSVEEILQKKKVLSDKIADEEARLRTYAGCESEMNDMKVKYAAAKQLEADLNDILTVYIPKYENKKHLAQENYKKLTAKRDERDKAQEEHDRLNDAYHGSAAWMLSSELQEGEPCPVCGSVHHPAPAQRPALTPEKSQVDAARTKYETICAAYSELDKLQQRLDSECSATSAVIDEKKVQIVKNSALFSGADQKLEDMIAEAQKEAKAAGERYSESLKRFEDCGKLSSQLENDRKQLHRLQEDDAAARGSLEAKKTRLENISEAFSDLIRQLPERLALGSVSGAEIDVHIPANADTGERISDDMLASSARTAKLASSDSDEALSQAQREVSSYGKRKTRFEEQFRLHMGSEISDRSANEIGSEINEELAAANGALERAKKEQLDKLSCTQEKARLQTESEDLDNRKNSDEAAKNELDLTISRLEEACANTEQTLSQLRSELAFGSEAEVRAHIEKLRADADTYSNEITQAQKISDEIGSSLNRLEGNIAQLQKSLDESPAKDADVASRKEALKKLQGEKQAQSDLLLATKLRLDGNNKQLRALAEGKKQRANAQEEADTVSLLYHTITGTLSGREKLDLETFVQLHYFDTVIANANERLKFMTNEQYELKRRSAASDLKSSFGLDLNIVDYFCADPEKRERDVTSISGGEKFKVSLSLALGLSDEIMRRAGAVRFDTLFVDEGFGSLDGESLNLALEVLDSLSSADDRLIGIISHVEALKDSIDRQLVVRKSGGEGSRIEIK